MSIILLTIAPVFIIMVDIHIEIQPVPFEKLSEERRGEPSHMIRKRVTKAREVQSERFKENEKIHYNAQMNVKQIRKYCDLTTLRKCF